MSFRTCVFRADCLRLPLSPSSLSTSHPTRTMATILVVGSMDAATDGTYQSLVNELSSKGRVDMQMYDRILAGGQSLSSPIDPGQR
jgi:hypothetical protein